MRPREGLVVATGIFAGIAVDDYGKALEWYRRLLGAEPSFYPNDVEAVWQLAEDRFVYIIVDPRRAGGAVNMIWFDDPAATVAAIKARGLEPTEIEKHDPVWKYVFHDPDGNEIGIGGNRSGTD
jgi:catechol 2,3-dioxygenase-like lactoylglutathione lyase family enzyme